MNPPTLKPLEGNGSRSLVGAAGSGPRPGYGKAPDPDPEGLSLGTLAGLIVTFWTVYGLLLGAILLGVMAARAISPVTIFGFALGGAYLWALLSLPIFWVVREVQRKVSLRGIGWALLGAIGLTTALFVSTAVSGIAHLAAPDLNEIGFTVMFRYRLPHDLLAAMLVLAAGAARDYLQTLRERQREAAALQSQLIESRLSTLRAQLNPHFLFNTLNAIGGIATSDPRRAQRILSQLSDLLRYMLYGSTEQEITLDAELGTLRRYFDILELRYDSLLKTSVTCDPEIRDALVPNLILQPLAENALKHGIGRAGRGWIEARAERDGEHLILTIADSGPGRKALPPRPGGEVNGGFGLRHVRERLVQLYGPDHRLDLHSRGPDGMTVEVRIPYHTQPASVLGNAGSFDQ
jgi:two-component system, LytTR family, sensor kinase